MGIRKEDMNADASQNEMTTTPKSYHNITFRGFEPARPLTLEFSRRLAKFSGFCPSDSYLTVEIAHTDGLFKADASLRFQSGPIEVHCEGDDCGVLLDTCIDHLYNEIRIWREFRHTEPFRLDATQEAEGYEAYRESAHTGVKRARVLVVEDDPGTVTVLNAILEKIGCEITPVTDGPEAVEEMASNKYDLVILDWNLPHMNGGEVLREAEASLLRAHAGVFHTPVIVCSGMEKDRIQLPISSHFNVVDHWDKSLPFSSILVHANSTIPKLLRPQ